MKGEYEECSGDGNGMKDVDEEENRGMYWRLKKTEHGWKKENKCAENVECRCSLGRYKCKRE